MSARLHTFGSAAAAALVISFGGLAPAQASLIGDTVTLQLLSPDGILDDPAEINETQNAQVGAGVEFPGGGLNGFLLENELIDFDASSIRVRVQQGVSGSLITGYSDGARYIFSNLDMPGRTITGVSFLVDQFNNSPTITNLAALGSSWITLVDPRTVRMFIDDIELLDQGGGESLNVAEVTIQLTSVAEIPEPSTWLLLGAGLAGLVLLRRRPLASARAS